MGLQKNVWAFFFARPDVLIVGAIVVFVLTIFLASTWRRRRRLIRQFVQPKLLGQLTVGVSTARQKVRMALFVGAVICLLLAMARPVHGRGPVVRKTYTRSWVFVVDVSRSMGAKDVGTSRLEAARLAILQLLEQYHGARLGLVAFAGGPGILCPLSGDPFLVRDLVQRLEVGAVKPEGTDIGAALESAGSLFRQAGTEDRAVLLFTDGEDFGKDLYKAVQVLRSMKVRVFVAGIGTTSGVQIQAPDPNGKGWKTVRTRLHESLLQEVARNTDGQYQSIQRISQVEGLVQHWLPELERTGPGVVVVQPYREQYHWFVLGAIVLLVLETLLPDRRRSVPKPKGMEGSLWWGLFGSESPTSKAVVALLLLGTLFGGTSLQAGEDPGLQAYREGKFTEALRYYQAYLKKHPDDPKTLYNLGVTAYQLGKFQQAAARFTAVVDVSNRKLAEAAWYNLGNSLYQIGQQTQDLNIRADFWQQAVRCYEKALELDPNDSDARHNLNFAKSKLQELLRQLRTSSNPQGSSTAQSSSSKSQVRSTSPSEPSAASVSPSRRTTSAASPPTGRGMNPFEARQWARKMLRQARPWQPRSLNPLSSRSFKTPGQKSSSQTPTW